MRIHQHDSGSLPPAARGRALGERWAGPISHAIAAYQDHFRQLGISDHTAASIGADSYHALRSWSPGLAAELSAISDGAGVPLQRLSMLNARTEVLVAAPERGDGECSTAVRATADAPAVAFQTWDWHAALVPDALMWRYENEPGHWVKTFTEPGMLAKIGINSMGLAVCFNLLRHRDDSTTGGVPVHAIARRVLDEAATVDQACQIAASAQASASTVLTVLATGSGTPEAAAIEISPAGAATVSPGTDGWLTHTNHFLAPSLRDNGVIPELSTTISRHQHLDSIRSDAAAGPGLAAFAKQICGASGEAAPICVAEDPTMAPVDRWSTLLTVLLDPVGGSMEHWAGNPYQAAQVDPAPRF